MDRTPTDKTRPNPPQTVPPEGADRDRIGAPADGRTPADLGVRLGEFLQARRARVRPEDVGLRDYGRRRVPGLRRQELAELAGVSVDYYVRLEQGRAAHPSPEVLDALGRALLLDDVALQHLHDLAASTRPRRGAPRKPERVRPAVRQLLDRLDGVPAFVLDRRMNVLAWNRLAAALIADFGAIPPAQRNIVRFMFLDERARDIYPDWDRCARENVGFLRRAAGQDPDDAELAALVGELSMKSEQFARWWGAYDVREKAHGSKRYRHPVVGELTVHYETLVLPQDPGQALVTYSTEPGSESETALRLLASWAAEPPAGR
jgi:transcriptional regulator with XRE-family HTH domain